MSPKFDAHRQAWAAVQARPRAVTSRKPSVAQVAVEPGPCSPIDRDWPRWLATISASDRAVVGDEDVEPAVVVVVPEPAGEAVRRPGHAQRGGDVGEGAVAVVVVESAAAAHVGDVRSSQPSPS